LEDAIDADAAAYDAVVAAYRLPKSSPAEQEARKTAIDRALRGAIDVPMQVVRLSGEALRHAESVARHGQRSAASDVGVAIALLGAGLRGAALNVGINLGGVKDESYATAVRTDLDRLSRASAESAASAERTLA